MKSSKLPGMLSVKSKKGLDYMDMILKTTDLCKNFKGQMAVNNVSLNIRRNSVYGLLGPNGAGKSTILKMLTGILRPTSGSIEFDGHPWKRNDLEHIGALIEMPPLYENLTAYENLKVRTTLLGLDDARINEVLQIVQLTNTGKKRAGQFSLGMKQRLAIALAVMHDPERFDFWMSRSTASYPHRYCRSTLLYSGALRRKRKNYFDFQSHSFGDFLAG